LRYLIPRSRRIGLQIKDQATCAVTRRRAEAEGEQRNARVAFRMTFQF
jgi:hypothetical protein